MPASIFMCAKIVVQDYNQSKVIVVFSAATVLQNARLYKWKNPAVDDTDLLRTFFILAYNNNLPLYSKGINIHLPYIAALRHIQLTNKSRP